MKKIIGVGIFFGVIVSIYSVFHIESSRESRIITLKRTISSQESLQNNKMEPLPAIQDKSTFSTSNIVPTDLLMAKNKMKLVVAQQELMFLRQYPRLQFKFYFDDINESWSYFPDTLISLVDSKQDPLLKLGPYYVHKQYSKGSQKEWLLYNENQKYFAIFTGRVAVKLKDLFESEKIEDEYQIPISKINTDIKTVYYQINEFKRISELREALSTDRRIEYFHFEVVHNKWQKN